MPAPPDAQRLIRAHSAWRVTAVILKFPWVLPDYPADKGVLRHPRRQQLLAISKCLATSRAHPAQLNAQLSGQQAAQGLPQSRALGVARVVHPQPVPQVLPAGRLSASWRPARADPRIQQGQAAMLAALCGIDERRKTAEPPPVYPAGGWDRRWPGEHLISRKHPRRVQETRDLRRPHGGSLQRAPVAADPAGMDTGQHLGQDRSVAGRVESAVRAAITPGDVLTTPSGRGRGRFTIARYTTDTIVLLLGEKEA